MSVIALAVTANLRVHRPRREPLCPPGPLRGARRGRRVEPSTTRRHPARSLARWRLGRPEGLRLALTEVRRFLVRTFGCQMNEHDSERIASVLVGRRHGSHRQPRGGRRRRAQHLLHPPERRRQALRPPRAPEVGAGARDPASRSPSGAASPRRTASCCWSGRRTSTRSSAPTTSARVAALLELARDRAASPVLEVPDAPASDERDRLPDRDGGPTRPAVRRVGDDPGRLRQLLRLLHRPLGARARGEPPLRRARRRGRGAWRRRGTVEITLLGQNVNSYGRDLTTRWRGRRRAATSSSRSLAGERWVREGAAKAAAAVRRPAPGRRRGGRDPPRPVHEPASEGPPARDDRRHGRDRGGLRAAPPAAAVGQRPGAGGHAPRLHRRALPGPAGGGESRDRATWR